jgi:hypothetical protein
LIDAPTRHRLAVSRLVFTDHKTGRLKLHKEGRAPYVLFIAETILAPDEIWMTEGGHGDRSLNFLTSFRLAGKMLWVLAVFKKIGELWEGWSGYPSTNERYISSKRSGVLLYRRP